MKAENQTTQAIFTKLKEYREVIPLIVERIGLSNELIDVDEIEPFHSYKGIDGNSREIDGHIISRTGKIIVWFEFKLGKEFDEEQLQNEYEALLKEAKNKNIDFSLVGVSEHSRKPNLFYRMKRDGFKYEWLSYEHIRKAFQQFSRSQDSKTKQIIRLFLTDYFKQPFKKFNRVHFSFISDSIASLDDLEDFGEKCASVDRQINDFVEAIRKAMGKAFKITIRPVPQEWGSKGIVKLSIPERSVVNITHIESKKSVSINFDFRLREYNVIGLDGQVVDFDISAKNIVTSIRNIVQASFQNI